MANLNQLNTVVKMVKGAAKGYDEPKTTNPGLNIALGAFEELTNPEPGLIDTIDMSESVRIAKEKSEFINNSIYKYLIDSKTGRDELQSQLNVLDKQILLMQGPYDSYSENLQYKQAILDYFGSVRIININYKQSEETIKSYMKDIDKKYK